MPRVIEKTVFQYSELSDKAKEKARDWWREGGLDYDWWDSTYEDAERVAKILGIEFDPKPVKLMGGGTRYDPCIFFSGFSSQGDGAMFEGRYSYAKGANKKIRAYAPKDEALASIADDLLTLQKANGYRLEARVKHSHGAGSYYHEYTAGVDATDKRTGDSVAIEIEKELTDILRRFMRWIYKQLESEYEYLMSDESVAETIEANEYEFTETGKRACV